MRRTFVGCGVLMAVFLSMSISQPSARAQAMADVPAAAADVTPEAEVQEAEIQMVPVDQVLLTPPGAPAEEALLRLHLWADGNLPGRVMLLGPNGVPTPGRGTITFRQDDEVIYRVRSDERGYFQVVRPQPGIYSVVASGPGGTAVFVVELLPYDPEFLDNGRLEIVLSPTGPLDGWAEPLLAAPPMMAPMPMQAPMGGGGGGGGAGGLAALGVAAGVAGLVTGVVALATSGAPAPLPSPFVP